MGIVFLRGAKPEVLEAVSPVRFTPLEKWVARGELGRYVAKRPRHRLPPDRVRRLRSVGESFLGRPYDEYFGWSDDSLYCSELVWKVYERATGIALGRLHRLGELDLSQPIVRAQLAKRYGEAIPLDQQVITPAAIFAAPELVTIHEW